MPEPAEHVEPVPPTIPGSFSPRRLAASLVSRPISWLSGVAAALVGFLLIQTLAGGTLAPVSLRPPISAPAPAPMVARPGEIPPWNISLISVAAASPSDVWAVGDAGTGAGPAVGLLLHYDGSSWRRVRNPVPEPLSGLSVLPSGEAWAVGMRNVLHESGGVWTEQYQYQPPVGLQAYLARISMVSSREGWAAGVEYGDTQHGLLLHYLDGVWTPASVTGVGDMWALYGIFMRSPDEGWAVGATYGASTSGLVLHYANGHWTPEASGITYATLSGVSAAGPDDAWVVGAGGPTTGIALHCVAGVCSQVDVPTPNLLGGVSMRSTSDGWIVGDGAATLRYDGRQWSKVGITIHGEHLTGVAMTSDQEGWAVGSTFAGAAQGSALLRCHNGSWQAYVLHIPDHET